MRRRFPFGLTIVCVVAFGLLISLGIWQVQRLQWKQGLIARSEAVADRPFDPATAPVLTAGGHLRRPNGVTVPAPDEFERVVVDCDFQHDVFRRVELQTIVDGEAGVRLISFCGGYLVDLGFIPETVSARPTQKSFRAPRPSGGYPTIVAQARSVPPPGVFALPPEHGRFFARDTAAIGRVVAPGRNVEDLTLFAESAAFPWFDALQPTAPPAAFSNNHLGYALTWFGLALAVIAFYIVLLRRRLRTGTPAKDSEESST